ncbi:GntR family transcriptional regulator [Rhizobium sp. CNPSo 3464]|uniref:GntR family transcriptional regulator n=1 Tax=Rhizobium sp. CNPSo 3464 TaxID=3021406 RepID=UPI002549FB85|nr:GntR family transcriptional regulator [Rhizobium sp. CNPSo 3464]MDK4739538.1 GntR family transcriptional regulator [Rhizobium sp. CNPSo 3464]
MTNSGKEHYFGSMDPKSIFSELRDEIESGELAPGSVLKQESIAERFGVSRQPVRQALDRLLGSGLVVRRPDRSLAVAILSEREASELTELRTILEVAALEQSVPLLLPSALRKAERLNDELFAEYDPVRIEELDQQFHLTLYSECENTRLLRTIATLRRESRRACLHQKRGAQERIDFFEEHAAIVAACARGDVDAAAQHLRHHLTQTTARLLSMPTKDDLI